MKKRIEKKIRAKVHEPTGDLTTIPVTINLFGKPIILHIDVEKLQAKKAAAEAEAARQEEARKFRKGPQK